MAGGNKKRRLPGKRVWNLVVFRSQQGNFQLYWLLHLIFESLEPFYPLVVGEQRVKDAFGSASCICAARLVLVWPWDLESKARWVR